MADEPSFTETDNWQLALNELPWRFALGLRELNATNPWPEHRVLDQAIATLATELWDQGFGVNAITAAFTRATADLPRYSAGCDLRQ